MNLDRLPRAIWQITTTTSREYFTTRQEARERRRWYSDQGVDARMGRRSVDVGPFQEYRRGRPVSTEG